MIQIPAAVKYYTGKGVFPYNQKNAEGTFGGNMVKLARERLANENLGIRLAASCLLGNSPKALKTLRIIGQAEPAKRTEMVNAPYFCTRPLHLAVLNDMTDVVKQMLELGADKTKQDPLGHFAAQIARSSSTKALFPELPLVQTPSQPQDFPIRY